VDLSYNLFLQLTTFWLTARRSSKASCTYSEYCVLLNDEDAENAESNLVSVQTIKKQVYLSNSRAVVLRSPRIWDPRLFTSCQVDVSLKYSFLWQLDSDVARVTLWHLSSMFVFLSFLILCFYCDNIFSVGLLYWACMCISCSLHLLLFLLHFVYHYII